MQLKALNNVMLLLVQGHILFEIPALRFGAVGCILHFPLGPRDHMINVVGSQVMVVDTEVPQLAITRASSGLGIRPCLVVVEDSRDLFPCHGAIDHVRVDERSLRLQISGSSSGSRVQNRRTGYHLLIQRKIILRRIDTCSSGPEVWPHNIAERCTIDSTELAKVFLNSFYSLRPIIRIVCGWRNRISMVARGLLLIHELTNVRHRNMADIRAA